MTWEMMTNSDRATIARLLKLCVKAVRFLYVIDARAAESQILRRINYSIILFSAHLELIYIAKRVEFYPQA
jgi:hypothetical protein